MLRSYCYLKDVRMKSYTYTVLSQDLQQDCEGGIPVPHPNSVQTMMSTNV